MEFTIGWDTDGDGGRVAVAATAPILLLFLSLPLSPSRSRAPSPARHPPSLPPREPNLPSPISRSGFLSFHLSLSLSLFLSPLRRCNDDGHAGISLHSSLSYALPRSYRPMRSLPCILRLRCAAALSDVRLTPLGVSHCRPPPTRSPPPPALLPAVPGTARCYPRAIRACAIYPFVRRAVPSPHPLPASRSPASTWRVRRPQSRLGP